MAIAITIPRQAETYIEGLIPCEARVRGFKSAEEGLPKSACSYRAGSRERTAWLRGWWDFQAKEDAREAATGRQTPQAIKDPKAPMRANTRAMFKEMKRK